MKIRLEKQVSDVLKIIAPENYKAMRKARSLNEFAPSIQGHRTCFVGELHNGNVDHLKYNKKKGTLNCRSCAVIAQTLYECADENKYESFKNYLKALAVHARFHNRKLPKIKGGFNGTALIVGQVQTKELMPMTNDDLRLIQILNG